MRKQNVGAIDQSAATEIYITAEAPEIEVFHAAGIREIAVRNGREYVFKTSEIEKVRAREVARAKGDSNAEDR